MKFNMKYKSSPTKKAIQIILLILIVIGLGLLATQPLWVPNLVSAIIAIQGK